MASRPAFLQREPRKPAVRPERRKKAGRPKRAAPRRVPAPQWRPAAKPAKPLFNPPKPFSPKPFGRRAAKPVLRRMLMRKLLRMPVRYLLPGLGWYFAAEDLGDFYSWYTGIDQLSYDLSASGFSKQWESDGGLDPRVKYRVVENYNSGMTYKGPPAPAPTYLYNVNGQVPTGDWPGPVPALAPAVPSNRFVDAYREQWLFLGPSQSFGARMGYREGWRRWTATDNPGAVVIDLNDPALPITVDGNPMPSIWELPYPYPGAVMPYPVAPPLSRPANDPAPITYSPPVQWPGRTPAIEIGPNGRVGTGTHFQRPPRADEREKKKRLTGEQARAWLRLLEATGGSFMEKDDIIAAMYKGLPWKLRRWRGKDGIWRDRDHTTTRRLSRLFSNLGSLDVGTALTEVAKNELGDAIHGKLGKALKDRTKQLADSGLWSGSRGLGQGTPLENSWEETYKRLKAEAAARDPARWYLAKHYDAKNGVWVRKWRQRPVTSIPWLRNRSLFDRRFTSYAYGGKPQTRPRYYYGAARQQKGGLPNGKEK